VTLRRIVVLGFNRDMPTAGHDVPTAGPVPDADVPTAGTSVDVPTTCPPRAHDVPTVRPERELELEHPSLPTSLVDATREPGLAEGGRERGDS
jgi:hypothetical protein